MDETHTHLAEGPEHDHLGPGLVQCEAVDVAAEIRPAVAALSARLVVHVRVVLLL